MAILQECPNCRNKLSTQKRKCRCGQDLVKAKKNKQVRYWLMYRLPGGKQVKKFVGSFEDLNGNSLEDAKIAESKVKTLKRENRLLDVRASSKMTFSELTDWYLNLEATKALASYNTIQISLKKFNDVFGDMIIDDIKPMDLENYQQKRLKEGMAPGTIDHEIEKPRTMINKAAGNDMVSSETVKAFKRVKKLTKRGSDIRDRILSPDEFEKLMECAEAHLKPVLACGYYTGMRSGEIFKLTWDRVDLGARMIKLRAKDTKDREARNVPICDELYQVLRDLPSRIQKTDSDRRVFRYKGVGMKKADRSLKTACKAAGIKYGRFVKGGFVFHDLRHTFNTNMRKAGIAESVIMKITGHSTREMFDRYNNIDQADIKNAIKKFENYFSPKCYPNVTLNASEKEKVKK
jgi:integrase